MKKFFILNFLVLNKDKLNKKKIKIKIKDLLLITKNKN